MPQGGGRDSEQVQPHRASQRLKRNQNNRDSPLPSTSLPPCNSSLQLGEGQETHLFPKVQEQLKAEVRILTHEKVHQHCSSQPQQEATPPTDRIKTLVHWRQPQQQINPNPAFPGYLDSTLRSNDRRGVLISSQKPGKLELNGMTFLMYWKKNSQPQILRPAKISLKNAGEV